MNMKKILIKMYVVIIFLIIYCVALNVSFNHISVYITYMLLLVYPLVVYGIYKFLRK